MKNGRTTSKYFGKLLKGHLRKAKKRWVAEKLGENNSKITWRTIKSLTAKDKSSAAKPYYTIDDQLMTTSTAAETLNKYFTSISGTPSDLDTDASASDR